MSPSSDPLSLVREDLTADPPEIANYRPADVDGIACAHCSFFEPGLGWTDDGEGGQVQLGFCDRWETQVREDYVCDFFRDAGPPLTEGDTPMADWNFADEAPKVAAEVHLAGSEQRDENGLVVKEILREGEWPVIPTNFGRVKKPLRVVRSGKSNQEQGIIAMEELVENFKAGAIPNVQIPLSDDDRDHKNTTRLNTGFVRGLRIEDGEDGARLVAEMEFTEPDVKERTLRGTYADVSCGIPWEVDSRGKKYGAALEHVAITNKPFISNLGPFLAMSDEEKEELQIDLFSQTMEPLKTDDSISPDTTIVVNEEEKAVNPEDIKLNIKKPEKPQVSYETQKELISASLNNNFNLSGSNTAYTVIDLTGNIAHISNDVAGTTWTVPYHLSGTSAKPTISLSGTDKWELFKGEESDEAPVEQKPAVPRSASEKDGLKAARRLREIRLSEPVNKTKEAHMPISDEVLERLELSDEDRAVLQNILTENAELKARTREQEVDARIAELQELGLNERPSALKLYREVMLSDDGGPAVILLSDEGQEKEQITATEVLDRFIEAVKGSDGKVVLSDQALVTGNDEKPPANAEGENLSVEERVEAMKQELYKK